MELKGKCEAYRIVTRKALSSIAVIADLKDVSAVELAIARSKRKIRDENNNWVYSKNPTTAQWKVKLCSAYAWYCKVHCIDWKERPVYHPDQKSIQPPSEEKIKMFMAYTRESLSIKIQISEETGLRPIEVTGEKGIRVKDIHPEQNTITAINTKRCNARPPMKISDELKIRLQTYISKHKLQPDEIIFKTDPKLYGQSFRRARNRLSKYLADPSIHSIRLYDIRHYYVSKICRKTQNAVTTQQIVGHKNLNTTQRYIHLAISENMEWITEQTQDRKRAEELTIQDFQYCFTTPDGWMQFKKAK